jgi:hypothetical protein
LHRHFYTAGSAVYITLTLMEPSSENQLLHLGEVAAKALAEGISRLGSFSGSEGGTYSVRLVGSPELRGSNWFFVVDVVFPDDTRSIEFSVVQTGWGGFDAGVPYGS